MAEDTGDLTLDDGASEILSILSRGDETVSTDDDAQKAASESETSDDESATAVEAETGESDRDTERTTETDQEDASQDGDVGEDARVAETLSELAEAYETDVSELYKIKVPYNVNGESKNFTLSEVKDIVQDHQRIKTELETVRSAKSALETERQEGQGKLAERLNELASLVNVIEKQLDTDENSDDMKELKNADPGMWSAQRQEITERRNALNQVKAQATQIFQQQQKEWQDNFAKQRQDHLTQEIQRLHMAIPEWSDSDVAQKEKGELSNFLVSNGFSEQEIANVDDHRLIVIARMAMLGSKVKTAADTAKKRIAKLPKVVKPGQVADKEDAGSVKDKALRGQLKESGRPEDAARLLLSRGL